MIHFVALGEKRAEVKAANPDDKIGDIAKVAACSVVVFNFTLVLQKMGKMWQELDEKAKVDCFFFMCKPFTAAGPL